MIIYGKQIVNYVLEKHPSTIQEIYLAKEIDKKLFSKFARLKMPIIRPDNQKAQAMAKGGNHQGFLLKIDDLKLASFSKIKKSDFLVVLDNITDVGNIGAIIRSCYSLGVNGIIVCGIKNFSLEGVIKTSGGTAFDMPVCSFENSMDLANELKQMEFELLAADLHGTDLKEYKNTQNPKQALFLGNEHEGLSNKILKKMDTKLSIKMHRDFDSLNVSVAAGIMIYSLKK